MKVLKADLLKSIQPGGLGSMTSLTRKTGEGKLLDIEVVTEGVLKKWLKVTRVDAAGKPLGKSFYVSDSNIAYLELAEEPTAPAKK